MTFPDLINGLFESVGGIFVLNHCRVLARDKSVAGVSKLSTSIFFAWGIWNLYYYPSLDQWLSFYGGMVIVCGNCLWLLMMLWYTRAGAKLRGLVRFYPLFRNAGYSRRHAWRAAWFGS